MIKQLISLQWSMYNKSFGMKGNTYDYFYYGYPASKYYALNHLSTNFIWHCKSVREIEIYRKTGKIHP